MTELNNDITEIISKDNNELLNPEEILEKQDLSRRNT